MSDPAKIARCWTASRDSQPSTGSAGAAAGVFAGVSPARSLWPHQERALQAFGADQAAGDRSTYLVVPPGGGKTLIGLECAGGGRPALVLCPNTAIQAQWIAQWRSAVRSAPGPSGDRQPGTADAADRADLPGRRILASGAAGGDGAGPRDGVPGQPAAGSPTGNCSPACTRTGGA